MLCQHTPGFDFDDFQAELRSLQRVVLLRVCRCEVVQSYDFLTGWSIRSAAFRSCLGLRCDCSIEKRQTKNINNPVVVRRYRRRVQKVFISAPKCFYAYYYIHSICIEIYKYLHLYR